MNERQKREYISPEKRKYVKERANGLCEYCQYPARYAQPVSFQIEHIFPFSQGGDSTVENLAYSCSGCNLHKSKKLEAIDPQSSETVPLFHPRRNRWEDHFEWNETATCVVGKTAVGRATVETLQINHSDWVEPRKILFEAGLHPPQKREPDDNDSGKEPSSSSFDGI